LRAVARARGLGRPVPDLYLSLSPLFSHRRSRETGPGGALIRWIASPPARPRPRLPSPDFTGHGPAGVPGRFRRRASAGDGFQTRFCVNGGARWGRSGL